MVCDAITLVNISICNTLYIHADKQYYVNIGTNKNFPVAIYTVTIIHVIHINMYVHCTCIVHFELFRFDRRVF